MKTMVAIPLVALATLTALISIAQPAGPPDAPPGRNRKQLAADDSPAIGPHHRMVLVERQVTGPDGPAETITGSYTELATGLNRFDTASGEWIPARAEFEQAGNGHMIARHTQHQAILAPDLRTEGAVDLLTPDGVRLRSTILGLGVLDTANGRNFLLAEVQPAAPVMVSPTEVIYPDAFDGVRADVRYRLGLDRFEQDLILREQIVPELLEKLGVNPLTARVFVMTEFFDSPEVRAEAGVIRSEGRGRELADVRLEFGQMAIGEGRAFGLERDAIFDDPAKDGLPVGKAWEVLEGRQFLIESVEYLDLVPLLEALPEPEQAHAGNQAERVRRTAALPRRVGGVREARVEKLRFEEGRLVLPPGERLATGPASPAEIASLTDRPGVVVDYLTLNTGQANFTFRADTTYLINGSVTLSGTTATFEGGTVIKYASGGSAKITVGSTTHLKWQGSYHRPVILTAKDDHGIGEKIGTATSVSGYYASTALELTYSATFGPFNVAWLRVAHAQTAISVAGGSGHVFRHLQLVNCDQGIVASGVTSYSVRNVLVGGVNKALSGVAAVTAEHLTVNGGALRNAGQPSVTLKNSLLTGVSDIGTGYGADSQVLTGSSGVFQTVQQGEHYLAAASPYRNWSQALTTIDSGLLADLRNLTTFPPVEVTSNFTVNTTLGPQAQRDTDMLDLGYHYLPLDYLISGRSLAAGCILLLTNGVSIGTHGTTMLTFQAGTARLVSEGTPLRLNQLAFSRVLQEQATAAAGIPSQWISDYYNGANRGYSVSLRYTGLALHGTSSRLIQPGPFTGSVSLQDCRVQGMHWYVHNLSSWGYSPNVVFKNNVVERGSLDYRQGYGGLPGYLSLTLQNNLFLATPLSLWYSNNSSYGIWAVSDNLFDTAVTVSAGTVPASYNGFVGLTGPSGWTQNKNNLSRDFVAGPLGDYYYPPTGVAPSLASLINADSTRAPGSVSLYHHTTAPASGTKEGTSALDIGFHYVALDAASRPLDTDGDGQSDYAEDRSGNGVANTGESNWQTSQNGTTGVPGLQVYTPMRP